MTNPELISIFISCPGDIVEEINSIRMIVDEINKSIGPQNNYRVQCLEWTQDTYTQKGEDPQDVINTQLEKKYDILVGILWQKIGTPTKRDKSGTIEEINRAISNGNKELLVYFNTKPPENLNDIDIKQLAKLNRFKKDLTKNGVLYKEFNNIDIFESLFRINLINLISEKLLKREKLSPTDLSINSTSEKYSEISAIIDRVEQREIDDVELDIFELVEDNLSRLMSMTTSLESMTTNLNEFTERMNSRASELKKIAHIKDERLRMNKTGIVLNLFSQELDKFSSNINAELPSFSENFLQTGPNYSKLIQYSTLYEVKDADGLKDSILYLRDSVFRATQNGAKLLAGVCEWPPMTSKFNKSKRETEISLKNLTKEMLQGLKLLDEALNQ